MTNYEAVLEAALKTGYINEEDVPVLDAWRKDRLIGMQESNLLFKIKIYLKENCSKNYFFGPFSFLFINVEIWLSMKVM